MHGFGMRKARVNALECGWLGGRGDGGGIGAGERGVGLAAWGGLYKLDMGMGNVSGLRSYHNVFRCGICIVAWIEEVWISGCNGGRVMNAITKN